MKNVKTIAMIMLVVALIAVTAVAAIGCNKKDAGTLVIGITDYAPMDFQKADGTWTGFDAEMARLVAAEIGYDKVEFKLINWDKKITELKSGKIDLIWNGMTVTEELGKEMNFSFSYATNYQVAVVKTSNLATLNSTAAMQGKKIVVEAGSAGEIEAKKLFGETVIGRDAQVDALTEVKNGTSDVAFVDYTMAAAMCGNGDFANLAIVTTIDPLSVEEFAVGIRKEDVALQYAINTALVKFYQNGTMEKLRVEFGKDSIALMDIFKQYMEAQGE